MHSNPGFNGKPSTSGSTGNTKRPKLKAGFVLDSDESDAEDYDDDGDDDDSIRVVLRPPYQRRTLDGRKTQSNAATLPTKQLNKNRLNTLLGRTKNASSHVKEIPHSAPIRFTTASPPASPFKQRQTPQPNNDKQNHVNSNITQRENSSSILTKPAQVSSRSIQEPTPPEHRLASIQLQQVKPVNNMNIAQVSANRTATASKPQAYASNNLQLPFPDATKNAKFAPYLTSQTSAGGGMQVGKVGGSPTLPSQVTQKNAIGRGPTTGTTTIKDQIPRTPIAEQPVQSTARQPPTRVQNSTGTIAGPQVPRPSLVKFQHQVQNPGSATRASPSYQAARGPASKPDAAPGMQLVQKRKAEDITGGCSDNATPLKKPAVGSGNSSVHARQASMKQGSDKAGVDSHLSLKIPATFDHMGATALSTHVPLSRTSQTGLQYASAEISPNIFDKSSSTVTTHPHSQQPKTSAATARRGLATPPQSATTKPVGTKSFTITNPENMSSNMSRTTLSVSSTLPAVTTQKSAAWSAPISPEVTLAPRKPNPPKVAADCMTAANDRTDVLILPTSAISDDAEPYFEYSIFQKLWSSEQNENEAVDTEIISRPYTNIGEANAQAEKFFHNIREQCTQHLHVQFSEWSSKRSHDCLVLVGTFSPIEYPIKQSHIKIWVQRDYVSKFANQIPQAWKLTPLISKTAYALRLFRLVSVSDDTDTEGDSHHLVRVHHKLPCSEIYTTLNAGNRAARNLQVELSHVKNPKDDISAKWQEQDLKALNAKVHALDPSMGGSEGYWKSEFNACGMGGDRLEVIVEKVTICGPRN